MTPIPGWAQAVASGAILFVALMAGGLLWRDYSFARALGIAATAALVVVTFQLILQRVRAGS
jgi:hypothetical protein